MFGKFIIKVFGGKKKYQHFFETLGNISHSVRYIGYASEKERYRNETLVLQKFFSGGNAGDITIFDVGANIGEYTQEIINLAGSYSKKYRIFAFEPAKKTYQKLTERFPGHQNVICINKALSDKEGTAQLYSDAEQSDLASIHNLKNAYRDFDDRFIQTIELTTLDHFMQANSIDDISYLKIDAEGHDYFVLAGAQNALRNKKIGAIQFEFGPPNIDSRIFFRDFWELLRNDYDMYRLIDNNLYPITKYTPQLEVFLITNFIAILKNYKF